MMNRREALKLMSVASAASMASPLFDATAAEAAPAEIYPFTLPDLPYSFETLEPHVDTRTMQIHHGKHHAAYVNNLNKALEGKPELAGKTLEDMLKRLGDLPESIQTTVRNNGGGHHNHSLFWSSLSPEGGGEPKGALASAITETFGSFAAFQEKLTKAALGQFGSGWAFLSLKPDGGLMIEGLPNQDSPLMSGRQPLFGIDVWEHAYYLHYQNRRADYVKAIWNVVNWPFVAARYEVLLKA